MIVVNLRDFELDLEFLPLVLCNALRIFEGINVLLMVGSFRLLANSPSERGRLHIAHQLKFEPTDALLAVCIVTVDLNSDGLAHKVNVFLQCKCGAGLGLAHTKEAADLCINAAINREVGLWLLLQVFIDKDCALVSDFAHAKLGDFQDPAEILDGLELCCESILDLENNPAGGFSNHHAFRQPIGKHN